MKKTMVGLLKKWREIAQLVMLKGGRSNTKAYLKPY